MPRMIRSVDQAIAVKEAHPEIVRQRLSVENSRPIRLIPERSPEHFVAGEFEVTIVNVSGCGTGASAPQSPAAALPLSGPSHPLIVITVSLRMRLKAQTGTSSLGLACPRTYNPPHD